MFFQGFEAGSLVKGVGVASQQDGNETQMCLFSHCVTGEMSDLPAASAELFSG